MSKIGYVLISKDEALIPVAFDSLKGLSEYLGEIVKVNAGGFDVRECLIRYKIERRTCSMKDGSCSICGGGHPGSRYCCDCGARVEANENIN